MPHPDGGILTGIAALRAALVPADRWARAALRWAEEGGADLGEHFLGASTREAGQPLPA
ncbi:MAG: hypothetical protein HUU15_08325, partial [Candidatus Brocadiae bacterium]|nr:hypothetical protein [Candidatus Brocadiia bacterium]